MSGVEVPGVHVSRQPECGSCEHGTVKIVGESLVEKNLAEKGPHTVAE